MANNQFSEAIHKFSGESLSFVTQVVVFPLYKNQAVIVVSEKRLQTPDLRRLGNDFLVLQLRSIAIFSVHYASLSYITTVYYLF